MSAIGILATVVIRLASYGSGASIDGGDIGIATYRPGWESGVPKDVCRVTDDWIQETNGVTCVSRVKFLKDVDLQCVGLMWRMNATLTANRDWSADDKTRQVPETFAALGLGGGDAKRFSLPLPEGQTLVAEFPERVNYSAQDGRRWGEQWFIRFGPALGQRVHPAGEELVYRVRYTSPEGVRIERPEPCTMSVGENWAKIENRKDIVPGSALDFSEQGLQDAPAGKHGWLKSVGGRFEFESKPGVAQRFYGVNLCFTACYPTHEDADLLVDRLVRCGYNTIRVHHHDDLWAKKPDLRERLDYLIARAIARGLYVTTDLYVSRRVTWKEIGRDREGGPDPQLYKSLVLLDGAAYANWQAFARDFLEHVNPYTGRAYKDEPGLPLISLINEGNLGMGFGYSGKATDPTLLKAWREFTGNPNAASLPNPWTNERAKAFDADLERRFVGKATTFLRELGAKALLTNDNNGGRHGEGEGGTPLYDYVDNHFYIDHPEFLENRWQLPSKCPNANPVKLGQPRLFDKGYAKGASKPYAITEWNFSGPGRYRALGGVLTGALAARDEWDALWRFAYSHSRDNLKDGPGQCPGYFDCATDPLSQASDRASVCLFLRGDANEGAVTTDKKTGTMSFVSPRTCGGFVEQGRFKAGDFAADVSGAPAAVWASSLDGKPLAESRRMLVVHLTDVQGEGNVYADAARKILLKWGRGCLVEKGTAKVALVHPKDVTAWALDTTGRRVKELSVRRKGEWILFDCSTADGTIYYELAERPAASEVLTSGEWTVETRTDGGAWTRREVRFLPVGATLPHTAFPKEVVQEFGGIAAGTRMTCAALCEFDWEGPVDVRVTAREPAALALSTRTDVPASAPREGALEFRLETPDMGLVRRGDEYYRGLSLIARPRPAQAEAGRFRHVIRFAAGWHDAANDPRIVLTDRGAPVLSVTEDDTLVVLEPGARLHAAIDVRGAKRVEISGGGTVDLLPRLPHFADGFTAETLWGGFRQDVLPAVYVHAGAADVLVRDVTLLADFRGICARNAARLTMRDVRIFTSVTNADGINLIASEDVVGERLYIRSQDDTFCAYNNCDSIPWLWDGPEQARGRAMRRVRLTDSFLASNARSFVFGGHGISGVRGDPNVLEDFEVSRCRILGNVKSLIPGSQSAKHQAYWSGIFRILSQSDELVRDIRFRDCTVEWVPGYIGHPIHVCVRAADKVSYQEKSGGWKIEDVRFENVVFRNAPADHAPPYFSGVDPQAVEFSNVTYENKER